MRDLGTVNQRFGGAALVQDGASRLGKFKSRLLELSGCQVRQCGMGICRRVSELGGHGYEVMLAHTGERGELDPRPEREKSLDPPTGKAGDGLRLRASAGDAAKQLMGND